ncbi:MAG: carboxypeptidase regulatory-like domain-containing protein [Planctomycetota bacterium]|nr:carboxypeptidase regulatory-like domain-containing protein [Planctomycetota bacterium]
MHRKLKTNKQGQVTFEQLNEESDYVAIMKTGFRPAWCPIKLSEEDWQAKTYVLSPKVTVIGKVLSSETERGLKALVFAVHKGRRMDGDPESSTDAAGTFQIPDLAPGLYSLTVVAKMHAVQRFEFVVPEGKKTVTLPPISVEPLAAVDILVLDPEGKPVEGAVVSATKLGFRKLPMILGDMFVTSNQSTPISNKAGMVTLKNVAQGTVSFFAEKDGFPTVYAESVFVADAGTKVTLTFMKAGSELTGFCFDKSGVKKKRGQLALLRQGYKKIKRITVIHGDGSFQFQNITPGSYKLFSYNDDPGTIFDGGWFKVRAGAVTTQDYHESN